MTKKIFMVFLALVLSFVVFMPSLAYADKTAREADVQAIRELERMAREAAEAKDLERYVSFYAADAVLFWPGMPMVTGAAAIREFMRGFLSMPAFSLSFKTAKVEVAQAGDLAYTYGTNKVNLVAPDGKKMKDRGKYLTVYRKQPDGTWKVVADIGNSDLPAPVEEEKSVVIIYGSRYGSTAQTAKWIAEGMAGKVMVVAAKDAGDLGGYDKVILGSGIYGDQLHADMTAFLEQRGEEVKNKLLALFVVCGAPPDQAGGYLAMFTEKCGARPLLARAFNGWMKKELLSPEDFKGLEGYYKSIHVPFENYDRTDKAKCLAFGKEILEKLSEKK